MEVRIEVPELTEAFSPSAGQGHRVPINRATISQIHFEEGDEIEAGDVFASITNGYGTYEIAAPVSGLLVFVWHEEGDTISSDEVLATIDADR